MDILSDHELAVVRQAAGLLGRPAAGLDREGLVSLGGQLGPLKARLIGPAGNGPALVLVERTSATPLPALSERERQVAALIGRGLTNDQIAAELWISVATVKDHVHHILSKTGLANRTAVAGQMR